MGWPEGGCRAARPVGIIYAGGPRAADGTVFRQVARRPVGGADHGALVRDVMTGDGRLGVSTVYFAQVAGRAAAGDASASVDTIMRALDWLAGERVDLVNASLAGPLNKILDRAVELAAARGMVIVAAVGNEGRESAPRYPAALSRVIAVTAVDADARGYASAGPGPHVEIAAPGVDLFVSGRYVTGSSYATPVVTAFLATLPAEALDLGSAREALRRNAEDLGAPGRNPVFGHGPLRLRDGCGG